MRPYSFFLSLFFACAGFAAFGSAAAEQEYVIDAASKVGRTISSFRVGMSLLTDGDRQYVAYYDPEHRVTIASRRIDPVSQVSSPWTHVVLDSKVGWDSHNYLTMAVDSDRHLHVSGNMHAVPLVYYRTEVAGDVRSLQSRSMTGSDEERCTYPGFLTDHDGNLLFVYRSGGSGNGRRIFNRYDPASQTWTRFLKSPLLDGENQRNAYPSGPTLGPDGYFHLTWVWRDTPDCATSHHVCHARSRDLQQWETLAGVPLNLPLTLGQTATYVDPVASGRGLINSGFRMTFDHTNRPMVFYHRRDDNDHMQIYVARMHDGHWQSHCLTNWTSEVPFSGRGSMPFIGISFALPQPVETVADPPAQSTSRTWEIQYRHIDEGHGRILFDEETLQPVERETHPAIQNPLNTIARELKFPGSNVHVQEDLGTAASPGVRYVLRWESLGAFHDRRPEGEQPPPSSLQVIRLIRR